MKSLNLNYLRGVYDFLFGKSDEELEGFDINLDANRKILFEEMGRSFSKFGPISKENIINGINFILINCSDDQLWRSAIPHDLPLNRVIDRRNYLKDMLFALTKTTPSLVDAKDFVLIDEIGPNGLDYSK
ncbi:MULTISPECIES: hypothetical protein [Variovorax]|jgi:hypothetical protein|uniref:hypothetical protein n=1 Tax=Variovorax TaxID=34072 RepID=UPI000AB2846C|nr:MULTISPECIES: hypothetical protein [Variovorax]UKI05681.1 hypothetical protein L3V85_22980 [Variovorax paradoxus]